MTGTLYHPPEMSSESLNALKIKLETAIDLYQDAGKVSLSNQAKSHLKQVNDEISRREPVRYDRSN